MRPPKGLVQTVILFNKHLQKKKEKEGFISSEHAHIQARGPKGEYNGPAVIFGPI
jgi:hypothetical protein